METYLFKFSACLAIFWFIYILFLERQTMHRFKRFYLLTAVASALIIPVLTITHYIEPIVGDFEVSPLFIPMDASFVEIPQVQAPFWDLETVLWMVYGLGVLLFSIRFLVNLFKMYKRISDNETITKRSFIYVLLEECSIPHSFFKYLFFDRSKYETNTIPNEVKLHEETHAKQLHSLDIIVIELLQIVFWFHPLIYILKHHIKLNHEFLADQEVLKLGIDTKTYQNLLLQFSSNTQEYQLSSAINYSSIKKRFTVMKTQTSKTRIWLSSLLLLPIIAILFYSFAEREYVEKQNLDTSEVLQVENESRNEGATEAMMKEHNDWMKKLNNNSSSLFIPVGTWERLVAIYDLMSEEQRNSVETHPFLQEIITPALYSVEPSIPTAAQFESWENEKEFAIWLDGKHISNSELNNYKINDIAHYVVGSSFHGNAKSKKFAQPFKFSLYTKDGFNKFYTEAYVSGYKEICNEYSIAIHDYLKGSQTDNSELRIIKAQADKFYNQFTKEELKKHNILPVPPVPAEKKLKSPQSKTKVYARSIDLKILNDNSYLIDGIKATKGTFTDVFNQLHQDITLEVRNKIMNIHVSSSKDISNKEVWFIYNSLIDYGFYRIVTDNQEINRAKGNKPFAIESGISIQQKATAKQVAEYNAWAKGLNALELGGRIVKKKDYDYCRRIYDIMSDAQRKNAEPFPQLPPPPPPPPSIKSREINDSQIEAYNNWVKNLKDPNVSNRMIKKEDYNYFMSIYTLMTDEQKKKTNGLPPPPPPPEKPKDKSGPIEINGATYYFTQKKGKTTYFDRYGKVVDINKIPPPPPIPDDATPEQKEKMKKATQAYMKANPDKVGKAETEKSEVIEVIEIPSDLQGSVDINGETFYYRTSNGKTTYFNKYGKEVKMDNLPPPPPAPKVKKGEASNIPPPPPAPETTLDFVIRMAKANAKFINDGKSISSDDAIVLIKKNPKLNVSAQKTDSKQPLVYFFEKPRVKTVKGKN